MLNYTEAKQIVAEFKNSGIDTNVGKVNNTLSKKHLDTLSMIGVKAFVAALPEIAAQLILTESEKAEATEKRELSKAYNSHVRELGSEKEIVDELLEAARDCGEGRMGTGDYYKRMTSCGWALQNFYKKNAVHLKQAAPTPAAAPSAAPSAPQTDKPAATASVQANNDTNAMIAKTLDSLLSAVNSLNTRVVSLEHKKPAGRPKASK